MDARNWFLKALYNVNEVNWNTFNNTVSYF